MDDIGFGRLVRLARIRREWRQEDLARRAGVSRTSISRIERGHFGEVPLGLVRRVAAPLDIRVELSPRARSLDIDRVLNVRHSSLAAHLVQWFGRFGGWAIRPEVSFSEFGERGVIDLLCWHAASGSLLVVEIKTELLDFNELLGVLDRKERLATRVVSRFGWRPLVVSRCLLVADSSTNRRRAADHGALLRAALPDDGRALVRWLREPGAPGVHALRFVPDVRPGHARSGFAGPMRVRARGPRSRSVNPRSA